MPRNFLLLFVVLQVSLKTFIFIGLTHTHRKITRSFGSLQKIKQQKGNKKKNFSFEEQHTCFGEWARFSTDTSTGCCPELHFEVFPSSAEQKGRGKKKTCFGFICFGYMWPFSKSNSNIALFFCLSLAWNKWFGGYVGYYLRMSSCFFLAAVKFFLVELNNGTPLKQCLWPTLAWEYLRFPVAISNWVLTSPWLTELELSWSIKLF